MRALLYSVLLLIATGESVHARPLLVPPEQVASAFLPKKSRAELEELVRTRVESELPRSLVLKRVQITGSPRVRYGTAQVTIEWKRAPGPGLQTARVAFVSEDASTATMAWARLELRTQRQVFVARRDLAQGDVLAESDVAVAWREAPRDAASLGRIRGARVVEQVAAGEIVTLADLATIPPVLQGTNVDVLVRAGAMEITSRGRLERAARPGDETQVRLVTGRVVSGLLLDERTVLLKRGRR